MTHLYIHINLGARFFDIRVVCIIFCFGFKMDWFIARAFALIFTSGLLSTNLLSVVRPNTKKKRRTKYNLDRFKSVCIVIYTWKWENFIARRKSFLWSLCDGIGIWSWHHIHLSLILADEVSILICDFFWWR